MATQVVSNQQQSNNRMNVDGSTDNLSGGPTGLAPSYANAVLKIGKSAPRPDTSDKENIASDCNAGGGTQRQKDCNVNTNNVTCPKASEDTMAVGSSPQDDGGSFTTVTNHHSRKERKKEERQAKRHTKVNVNGVSQPKDTDKVEKDEKRHNDKTNQSTGRPVLTEQDQESVAEKKVFVEAPLPKVNPWQANRNAAQVLLGQQQGNDKRVLQNISGVFIFILTLITTTNKYYLHIAGSTTANTNSSQPSVVRASKDRKKYNAKVSALI